MELPRFFMTLSCANLAWDELKSTIAILCRETCSPSALTLLTVKLGLQYLTWRLIPIFYVTYPIQNHVVDAKMRHCAISYAKFLLTPPYEKLLLKESKDTKYH